MITPSPVRQVDCLMLTVAGTPLLRVWMIAHPQRGENSLWGKHRKTAHRGRIWPEEVLTVDLIYGLCVFGVMLYGGGMCEYILGAWYYVHDEAVVCIALQWSVMYFPLLLHCDVTHLIFNFLTNSQALWNCLNLGTDRSVRTSITAKETPTAIERSRYLHYIHFLIIISHIKHAKLKLSYIIELYRMNH